MRERPKREAPPREAATGLLDIPMGTLVGGSGVVPIGCTVKYIPHRNGLGKG
jgi:hypothetical protein